jgi:hypothetical protein
LKITPSQKASIVAWAQAEPLSSAQLLARHLDAGGTPVHLKTVVNLLGRQDFVWKRTRASLKKRNEAAFRAAQAEISGLREQAAAGQIVLGYLDEAGFCAVHPNRSAWTPVGTQHFKFWEVP